VTTLQHNHTGLGLSFDEPKRLTSYRAKCPACQERVSELTTKLAATNEGGSMTITISPDSPSWVEDIDVADPGTPDDWIALNGLLGSASPVTHYDQIPAIRNCGSSAAAQPGSRTYSGQHPCHRVDDRAERRQK
jgi:hypothetical protein